jgi:hypothetical protein
LFWLEARRRKPDAYPSFVSSSFAQPVQPVSAMVRGPVEKPEFAKIRIFSPKSSCRPFAEE